MSWVLIIGAVWLLLAVADRPAHRPLGPAGRPQGAGRRRRRAADAAELRRRPAPAARAQADDEPVTGTGAAASPTAAPHSTRPPFRASRWPGRSSTGPRFRGRTRTRCARPAWPDLTRPGRCSPPRVSDGAPAGRCARTLDPVTGDGGRCMSTDDDGVAPGRRTALPRTDAQTPRPAPRRRTPSHETAPRRTSDRRVAAAPGCSAGS